MSLLEMPDCVLDEIFQHLSYDEIAKKRLVSTKINKICQSLLNRGVIKLQSRIVHKIQKLEPLLPRKQSERWNHTAYKKIQFLESLNNEVYLLLHTYKHYIDENLCCFIPGNIIDLSLYMMRCEPYPKYWSNENISVEYRDAICMAKEHFRDQIRPTLRKLKGQKHNAVVSIGKLLPGEEFRRRIATVEPSSIQKATGSSGAATMDVQQNAKKCKFEDRGNCQDAYLRLNKKYNGLLRIVNLSSKAISKQAKQLTRSRKEVAALRRRLEKCEARNQGENGEQTDGNIQMKVKLRKLNG